MIYPQQGCGGSGANHNMQDGRVSPQTGHQSIAPHHVHIHSRGQFSVANSTTIMFLDIEKKLHNLEELNTEIFKKNAKSLSVGDRILNPKDATAIHGQVFERKTCHAIWVRGRQLSSKCAQLHCNVA